MIKTYTTSLQEVEENNSPVDSESPEKEEAPKSVERILAIIIRQQLQRGCLK